MPFYGCVRSTPNPRDHAYTPPRTRASLPPVVDLREHFPPAWDQGKANTCVPHAVGALVAYVRVRAGLPPLMPSRLFTYYEARMRDGRRPLTDTGCSIRSTVEQFVKAGVCDEAKWPYQLDRLNTPPATPQYFDARMHRPETSHYASLSVNRDPSGIRYDLASMKACLAGGLPFTLGLPITDHLRTENGLLVPPYGPLTGREEAHCLLAVGYDDGKAAFLARNSWGPGYGDRGHLYVGYDLATQPLFAFDLFTIDGWGPEVV